MHKTHPLTSLVLAGGLMFAASSLADAKPSFSELDRDGDGYVSQEEAQAHPQLASVFAQADENGDGRLDRSEFDAALEMISKGRE